MEKLIKASLGLLILILLAMLFLLRSPKRNSAAPSPSPVGSIPAPSPATANETTAVAEPSPIALAPPIAQPAAPVTPSGGNMSASKIKEFAPPTIPAEMAARPPEIPSVIAPPAVPAAALVGAPPPAIIPDLAKLAPSAKPIDPSTMPKPPLPAPNLNK
jgi:hypothetical protein